MSTVVSRDESAVGEPQFSSCLDAFLTDMVSFSRSDVEFRQFLVALCFQTLMHGFVICISEFHS